MLCGRMAWEDEGPFGLGFTQRQSYFQKTEPEKCEKSRVTPSLSAGWGGHSVDSAVRSQRALPLLRTREVTPIPEPRSLWRTVSLRQTAHSCARGESFTNVCALHFAGHLIVLIAWCPEISNSMPRQSRASLVLVDLKPKFT